MLLLRVLVVVIGFAISCEANEPVSCRNAEGKAVDWYVFYKLPELKHEQTLSHDLRGGGAIIYQDSNSAGDWQGLDGPQIVTAHDQALFQTLKPVYGEQTDDSLFVLYNDQPPPKKDVEHCGHTKGSIAMDLKTDSGFWLVHSVPHFPGERETGYKWPSTGWLYGQAGLCISVSSDTMLKQVLAQLYMNHVHVFDSHAGSNEKISTNEYLSEILKHHQVENAPFNSTMDLKTVGGTMFKSFAKTDKLHQDLYWYLVSDQLGVDLYMEGWRHDEKMDLPSECQDGRNVYDVNKVAFNKTVAFSTMDDHAKWAISVDEKQPWVCVGDINRQTGQLHRGGGTVCQRNLAVYKSFLKLVQGYDKCGVKAVFPLFDSILSVCKWILACQHFIIIVLVLISVTFLCLVLARNGRKRIDAPPADRDVKTVLIMDDEKIYD